jgi:hypothetical protein
MAIGISKAFPMDLDLIARLMQFYGEHPVANSEKAGSAVGLNRPKVDGLNKLMGYLGLQQRRKLTSFGELVLKCDPYLKDVGTLCIFHYLLCANEKAEVWHFVSNEFIPSNKQFTRENLNLEIDRAGIGRGNRHLQADKTLFLNAYTTQEYHALQSLEYLKKTAGKNDIYRAEAVERVPALILGFMLYDRRQQEGQVSTISINELLNQSGQIGKVFLLQRERLMAKLRQLEAKSVIGISQFADLDNVTFRHLDVPLSLLTDYYREQS